MPLSGSGNTSLSGGYFYPQTQRPNSSYPSVVMREVAAVPSSTNTGKLYVASDNSLHYVNEAGSDIVLVSDDGGSVLSGNLVVSGSIEVLGQLFDGNSNLILSSAIGSVIAASGVLEFPSEPSIGDAHIVTTNSHLIFSSSAGSTIALSGTLKFLDGTTQDTAAVTTAVTGATNFFADTLLDARGLLVNTTGHLVLSSSVDSVVAVSGAMAFVNGNEGYHLKGVETDLILSASRVYVSGTFSVQGSSRFNNIEFYGTGLNVFFKDKSIIALGGSTAAYNLQKNDSTLGQWVFGLGTSYGKQLIITSSPNYATDHDHPTPDNPTLFIHSTLSPDVDNQQYMALYDTGSGSFIESYSGHLILSSAAGSNIHLSGTLSCAPYVRYIDIEAGEAAQGVTAPTWSPVGTFGGLAYDADAETSYLSFEVPDDWIGESDMMLKIYWTNEAGTALGDTETVLWSIKYRSIAYGSEDIENGTLTAKSVTHTQSGAGGDGDTHTSLIVLNYDDANQPLALDDVVGIAFSRSFSVDTYGNDAVVNRWEIQLSSSGMPRH